MARDTLGVKAPELLPAGVRDSLLLADRAWFQTNGVNSNSQLFLQRCNGKKLLHKFSAPILAIHGGLRDRIIIETTTAIYSFDLLTDPIPL